MSKTIFYPSKPASIEITDAEHNLIWNLYNIESKDYVQRNAQNKITAIKFARQQYNLGLYEAKSLCDTIGAMPQGSWAVHKKD